MYSKHRMRNNKLPASFFTSVLPRDLLNNGVGSMYSLLKALILGISPDGQFRTSLTNGKQLYLNNLLP